MAFGIRLRVSGEHACFTRPELKVERVSYDVMTPSAARGILEAIYWKPAIRWVIGRIHVLRPIRFRSIRRNEVGSKVPVGSVKRAMKAGHLDGLVLQVDEVEVVRKGDDTSVRLKHRQQRAATVLVDVDYVIEAHFELTERAGAEDNAGKHLDSFNRRTARGQCFHQPCLGEFPARFEPVEAALPPAIGESRDLGLMLWDIDHRAEGAPSLFFRAKLRDGVMEVPQPGAAEILR